MKVLVKKGSKELKVNPVTGSLEIMKENGEHTSIRKTINTNNNMVFSVGIGQFEAIEVTPIQLSEYLQCIDQEQLSYQCSVIKQKDKIYLL